MAFDGSEYQREWIAKQRAAARDVKIPPVVDKARRERCLADPMEFLATYFPAVYYNPWTDGQREMVAAVVDSAKYGASQAIAAPRGDGKTKVVEGTIIYCVFKGSIRFPVVVASDAKASGRIIANLKWMLSADCHKLAEDFPEVCAPIIALGGEPKRAAKQTVNGRPTNIGWGKDFIRLPDVEGSACSGAIIYPLSIEGGMRGLAMGAERPDFVLLDDPETRESAASDYQVGLREEVIDRDVAGLKGQRGRIGMAALLTIQNNRCLAARLTDRSIKPSWNGFRRGMLAAWPTRSDLWDEYMHRRRTAQEAGDRFAKAATAFYLEHREEMELGADVTNPHRYNKEPGPDGELLEHSALQACFNFICDKGIEAFKCEYQNDPESNDGGEIRTLSAKAIEVRVSGLEQAQLPDKCIGVTAAIDVGKYACHWAVTAWQQGGCGHVIDYGVAEVHGTDPNSERKTTERAIRNTLMRWHEEIACRSLADRNGEIHDVEMALVDSGDGPMTDAIYEFIKSVPAVPKLCASKGYGEGQGARPRDFVSGKEPPRIMGNHWFARLQQDAGVWVYHLDASFWKLWVHERFAVSLHPDGTPTPYSLSLFENMKPRQHHAYARHIVAEELVEEFIAGKGMRRGWRQTSPNNHWLDATYMCCAAASMLKFFTVTEVANVAPTIAVEHETQHVANAAARRAQGSAMVGANGAGGGAKYTTGLRGRSFVARRR